MQLSCSLCCLICGKTEELSSTIQDRLGQEIQETRGFSAEVIRMQVGGRCRTCMAGKDRTVEAQGGS